MILVLVLILQVSELIMQPTRECVSELTLVALRMHGPNVSSLQGLQWALYAIMLHVRAMVARRPHMLFRQNPA